MGIKRVVDTAFWTDGKVDEFSPEDKYFMLYLLTNPFTTQLGIYEISIKQVAFQMGYSIDAVKVLLDRFENNYGVIIYKPDTNLSGEVAIKNFLRHSIIKGGAPVRDCLIREMKKVKNRELISQVFEHIKDNENLNATVKNIISDYESGTIYYSNSSIKNNNDNNNDIHNENENDNDVSLPVRATNRSRIVPLDFEYQQIIGVYNHLCPSLSKMQVLSDPIKKDLDESLKIYSLDDFVALFKKANKSNFLKGENVKKWAATFDWLIKKDNIAKVLNGKFDNKGTTTYAGYSIDLFEQMLNEKC